MKKILVIGCNGFIGKACAVFFSMNYDVMGCDIQETGQIPKYCQIKSPADFNVLFSKFDFDICINASGSSSVLFSYSNPSKDRELNFENIVTISQAILIHSPDCRLVHFSSAAVYGNPISLPVYEEMSKHPISPYGKNKLDAEDYLKDQYVTTGLKSCSLRIFSAYGPGLHKQIFWDIFCLANKSKSVNLFGTGRESRDFIFIDDLVKCINLIIQNDFFNGESINVASGKEVSIQDAAAKFLSVLDSKSKVFFNGNPREGDPVNWRADISKISKLGFDPCTQLEDGLRYTVQEYKKYYSAIV